MDKAAILTTLREHQQELQTAGIVSLSLFGSAARGESGDGSDVDLLAEFDRSKVKSLLQVVHLQSMLSDALCIHVDLSSPRWLKQRVKEQAQREAVVVF